MIVDPGFLITLLFVASCLLYSVIVILLLKSYMSWKRKANHLSEEDKKILAAPTNMLPLYLNHIWKSKKAQDMFEDRLQKAGLKKPSKGEDSSWLFWKISGNRSQYWK